MTVEPQGTVPAWGLSPVLCTRSTNLKPASAPQGKLVNSHHRPVVALHVREFADRDGGRESGIHISGASACCFDPSQTTSD